MARKETTGSEAHLSQKSKKKDTTVSTNDTVINYFEVLRVKRRLDRTNKILRAPDKWLQLERMMRPDRDIEDLISALLEHKAELEKKLEQITVTGPSTMRSYRSRPEMAPPMHQAFMMAMRAADRQPWSGMNFDVSHFYQHLEFVVNCPFIRIGRERASDFRDTIAYTTTIGSGASADMVFWPLSQTQILPNATFAGDWTGETGANFWGTIHVPGGILLDPDEWAVRFAIFQFTIPAPPCDAVLVWGSRAIADAPTEWFVDADWGAVDTNWVVHESPEGLDFPSLSSFDVDWGGLLLDTHEPNATSKHDERWLDGSFEVKAGVSPRIYLGCTLGLRAQNGDVSTIKIGGLGDHFEFRNGITYIMAST